jgi:transposase InsO family protein
MDERMQFVAEYLNDQWAVAHLCRRFGISRKTGYKWIARYEAEGWAGLREHSRAPHHRPHLTPAALQARVVQLRMQHPHWGPRKLLHRLATLEPGTAWPAPSTAGEILHRHGLVAKRRPRRRTPPATQPLQAAVHLNDVWATDFKGWFRTHDGTRIDPLTLSDLASRYLLRCTSLRGATAALVQPVFVAAFREYGLPAVIRSDNGPPFASVGLGGLSPLAVWWIRLGIRPERIAPGHPEQNGRHERLHRTLKQATAKPPRRTWRLQQRAFEEFRQEYNHERPHEALVMQTPASCYTPSARAYPRRLPEIEYPSHYQVRRVRSTGEIKWRGRRLFVSEALIGEPVGLQAIDQDLWRIEFGPIPLALYHSYTQQFTRL